MNIEELKENIIKTLIPLLESELSGGCLKMSSDYYDDVVDIIPYFRTSGDDSIARRNKKLLNFMNKLDINSIPEFTREHLKSLRIVEIYDKYNDHEDDYIFENKTTNEYPLLKSNIKVDRDHYILSATEVVEYLEEMYGFEKTDFYTTAPNKSEIVNMNLAYDFDCTAFGNIIPLNYRYIEHNRIKTLDVIDKICADRGYFRAATQICQDKKGDFYIKCIYNPVRDIPVRDMVKNQYIYHCSYTDNYDSILDNGLIPKNNKDRMFDYPEDRLFFYAGRLAIEDNTDYAKMMRGVVRPRKERRMNTEMDVYMLVNVRKLPKDIEFFYDPNYQNCVYCTTPIARRYIERVLIADFSVNPAYFEEVDDDF